MNETSRCSHILSQRLHTGVQKRHLDRAVSLQLADTAKHFLGVCFCRLFLSRTQAVKHSSTKFSNEFAFLLNSTRTTVDTINFNTEQLSGNVLLVMTDCLLVRCKLFPPCVILTILDMKGIVLLLLSFIFFAS